MGLFSSSKSKSVVSNLTDIDTVTSSSLSGPSFALGADSSFRGEVGLTGENATDILLGFTQGAVELERLRARRESLGSVNGDASTSGGGPLFATLPTNKKPEGFDFKKNLPLIAAGLAIVGLLFFRGN